MWMEYFFPNQELAEGNRKKSEPTAESTGTDDLIIRSIDEAYATYISIMENETCSISGLEKDILSDHIDIVLFDCDTGKQSTEKYDSGMSVTQGNYYVYALVDRNGEMEKINVSDYITKSAVYYKKRK